MDWSAFTCYFILLFFIIIPVTIGAISGAHRRLSEALWINNNLKTILAHHNPAVDPINPIQNTIKGALEGAIEGVMVPWLMLFPGIFSRH